MYRAVEDKNEPKWLAVRRRALAFGGLPIFGPLISLLVGLILVFTFDVPGLVIAQILMVATETGAVVLAFRVYQRRTVPGGHGMFLAAADLLSLSAGPVLMAVGLSVASIAFGRVYLQVGLIWLAISLLFLITSIALGTRSIPKMVSEYEPGPLRQVLIQNVVLLTVVAVGVTGFVCWLGFSQFLNRM